MGIYPEVIVKLHFADKIQFASLSKNIIRIFSLIFQEFNLENISEMLFFFFYWSLKQLCSELLSQIIGYTYWKLFSQNQEMQLIKITYPYLLSPCKNSFFQNKRDSEELKTRRII